MKKRILSILLALAVVICMIPASAVTAAAEEPEQADETPAPRAIVIGSEPLYKNINREKSPTVWFAEWSQELCADVAAPYRVMSEYEAKLTLLRDSILSVQTDFVDSTAPDFGDPIYETSLPRSIINGLVPHGIVENDAIKPRYIVDVYGGAVEDNYWAISDVEYNDLDPSLRQYCSDYWLRTPSLEDVYGAYYAAESGYLSKSLCGMGIEHGVRYAFDLKSESVVLVSDPFGKNPGPVGPHSSAGMSRMEYKLTLLDLDSQFSASAVSIDKDKVVVAYSGADPDNKEYLSYIFTDQNGDAVYYGRIDATSESGELTVELPEDMKALTLYVFNEHTTGGAYPDISSALVKVADIVRIFTENDFSDFTDSVTEGNRYADKTVINCFTGDHLVTEKPIGDSNRPFSGTFLGNNIPICCYMADSGLFGCISEAVIKDTVVVHYGLSECTNAFVGGIANMSNNYGQKRSRIENCRYYVNISSHVSTAGAVVGSASNTDIIGCSEWSSGSVKGGTFVGGIVGKATDVRVENCVYSGTVEGANKVGGIVGGGNNITVIGCRVGNGYQVKGMNEVGGIIGTVQGDTVLVSDCVADAAVSGNDSVGGIVGINTNGALTVERCISDGTVTADNKYAGGIVGRSNKDTVISKCVNRAGVSVCSYAGGILGASSGGSDVTVKSCVNYGVARTEGSIAGGIVGFADSDNCRVMNCVDLGTVHSISASGGIVGENRGWVINCFTDSDSITAPEREPQGNIVGTNKGGRTVECYYYRYENEDTAQSGIGNEADSEGGSICCEDMSAARLHNRLCYNTTRDDNFGITEFTVDRSDWAEWIIDPEHYQNIGSSVAFMMNGHGGSSLSTYVPLGDKTPRPASPAEYGSVFGGWYAEKSCINEYDFDAPVFNRATAFAKWESALHFVRFYAESPVGGQDPFCVMQVAHGETVTEFPAVPPKANRQPDGFVTELGSFDETTPVMTDTDVFVNWRDTNVYTVRFYLSAGDDEPYAVIQYTEKTPGKLPEAPPEELVRKYSDSDFDGWYYYKNGVRIPFESGILVSSDTDVYAKYIDSEQYLAWNGALGALAPVDIPSNAVPLTAGFDELNGGVYIVEKDITLGERPAVSGDVTLIIRNGVTLEAPGLDLADGASLSVHSQSEGESAGRLLLAAEGPISAGINITGDAGALNLYGARITVQGFYLGFGTVNCEHIGNIGVYGGTLDFSECQTVLYCTGTVNVYGGRLTCSGGLKFAIANYGALEIAVRGGAAVLGAGKFCPFDSRCYVRFISGRFETYGADILEPDNIIYEPEGYYLVMVGNDSEDAVIGEFNRQSYLEIFTADIECVPGQPATCEEDGRLEYYYNHENLRRYSDAKCLHIIGDGSEDALAAWLETDKKDGGGKLGALGHDWKNYSKEQHRCEHFGELEYHIDTDGNGFCDICGGMCAEFATFTDTMTELTDGKWLVDGEFRIGTLTVNGDVEIYLKDGAVIEATGGIRLEAGNILKIYAESTKDGCGMIRATGTEGAAGIGGGFNRSAGILIINGGCIYAEGGVGAAGIGGGFAGSGNYVEINGGCINAVGGIGNNSSIEAAGIGGGYAGACGTVIINNVTMLTAKGGRAVGAGLAAQHTVSGITLGSGLRVFAGPSEEFTSEIYGIGDEQYVYIVPGDGEYEITVGTGDAADTLRISAGDTLPTGERVGSKYILGWTDKDGDPVTTYEPGKEIFPTYVETGMMKVKFQFNTPKDGKVAMRLIASVDTLDDYTVTGWLFSLTESDPEKGKAGVQCRESDSVYNAITAEGKRLTVKDVYKDSVYIDSSNYLFCYDITNIPTSAWASPIYVRPFVTLTDGTTVYGDTKAITIANYIK